MTYSIETITTLIGAHRVGSADTRIDWLLTDSRSLTCPEESLFFAIRTQKNDGHRYIRFTPSAASTTFRTWWIP